MSEVLKISSDAEVLSPLSDKRLPLKIDFTLKSARVVVVEMSELFSVYLVKDSYKQQAEDDKYCSFATITVFTGTNAARLFATVIKDHVTRLRLIFKKELCKLK